MSKGAVKTLKNSGKRLLHVRVWEIAFLSSLPLRCCSQSESSRGAEVRRQPCLSHSLVGASTQRDNKRAGEGRGGASGKNRLRGNRGENWNYDLLPKINVSFCHTRTRHNLNSFFNYVAHISFFSDKKRLLFRSIPNTSGSATVGSLASPKGFYRFGLFLWRSIWIHDFPPNWKERSLAFKLRRIQPPDAK